MDRGRQWTPLTPPKRGAAQKREMIPLPHMWKTATGSKGSVYSRNADGTVTRTKTAELQAEQARRGVTQDQSTTMGNTRFVHPDHHEGLIYAQMGGNIVQSGVIHKAIPWGKGATEPVPEEHVSPHPRPGWIPVEWSHDEKGRQTTHLGHPIESVD